MKLYRYLTILTLAILVLAGSAMAGKKPVGALLTSVRIAIVSGDEERYEEASALLDTIKMYYGDVAEAHFWRAKMYVDYFEKAAGPVEQLPYVTSFAAYVDTIHMTCDNKEINKKYRKKCDEYTSELDSVSVFYWRQFYNAAFEQVKQSREIRDDLDAETDSASQEYYRERLEEYIDSVRANLTLVTTLDSTDARPFTLFAETYEKEEKYDSANLYLKRALDYSEDRGYTLVQIFNNYVRAQQYCEALPTLIEYTQVEPNDMDMKKNLALLYDQCDKHDSAQAVYQSILTDNPDDVDALMGIGSYHSSIAVTATDSVSYYAEKGEEATAEMWLDRKTEEFEIAKNQFAKAFDVVKDQDGDDALNAATRFGYACLLVEDYVSAIAPFTKLVEMQPDVADNWLSLGDCHLKSKEFPEAARAYEKVVEIEPSNTAVWEKLEDLYKELGETENLAKAKAALNK